MEMFIKEGLKKTRKVGKEKSSISTEISTSENGKLTEERGKAK